MPSRVPPALDALRRRARATGAGRRPSFAARLAALSLALILAGALLWFKPFLTNPTSRIAEVPTPTPLEVITPFTVPARGQACMDSVAITPDSRMAEFTVRPVAPPPATGPPVRMVLSAAGYRSVAQIGGGYPGGVAIVPMTPPRRAVVGSVCFVNAGRTAITLEGTTEARSVARSHTVVDGASVAGDISLTFLRQQPRSIIDRLGAVLEHASNLTDGLVPLWLAWIVLIAVALTVPLGTVAAFYVALRDDDAMRPGKRRAA